MLAHGDVNDGGRAYEGYDEEKSGSKMSHSLSPKFSTERLWRNFDPFPEL